MAAEKARARSIKLPVLQFEALRVMGIEVPWIVSDAVPEPVVTPAPDVSVAGGRHLKPVSVLNAAQVPPRDGGVPPVRGLSTAPSVETAPNSGPVTGKRSVAQMVASAQEQAAADSTAAEGDRTELAAMDLQQLAQCVRDCQACGLSATRHHAVPGEGVEQPSLMVVGEAPGEQEDIQGLPFVGPSGQLLDNMLASIGLNRTQNVYIANTIKCRPPGNRNPRDDEIRSCMPYLERQIALLQPKVILAVGLFASQTLLKSNVGVQALRAQSHQIQIGGRDIPVIVTFHPAYLLRRPADKRLAWQDLKQVWSLLKT